MGGGGWVRASPRLLTVIPAGFLQNTTRGRAWPAVQSLSGPASLRQAVRWGGDRRGWTPGAGSQRRIAPASVQPPAQLQDFTLWPRPFRDE